VGVKMKRWLFAIALLMPACSKSQAPKVADDPEFDKAWSALTLGGAEPVFIEGELHGSGLMGEVRRAVDPGTDSSPLAKEVQGQLPDTDVVRVIRAHLPQVKGCYQVAERTGAVGSGKAILSLEIAPTGQVAVTNVIAPAFSASQLPQCISQNAKQWTFPRTTAKLTKKFSYPFVFVGG